MDNQETQAFALDTQMVLEPIFQEEHKALIESPLPLARKLFPEDEDKGAGEPSVPAVPAPAESLPPDKPHPIASAHRSQVPGIFSTEGSFTIKYVHPSMQSGMLSRCVD